MSGDTRSTPLPDTDRRPLVDRWYDEGYYGPTTIGQEIRSARSGGTLVFSSAVSDVEVDVASIRQDAEALARGLRSIGVGPGDVVAVQLPTTPTCMAMTAAVWLAGGVVLPVVDIYGRSELTFILEQSRARCLVVPTEWRGRRYADEASAWFGHSIAALETIVAVGDDAPEGTVAATELSLPGSPVPLDGSPDDLALVVYTSGTTSNPKGVRHSHNTVLANSLRTVAAAAPPVSLGTFPSGHIAGVLSILRPLLLGGDVVIMDRWSAKRAARLVDERKVVASMGTPFYLATLLDEAERGGWDLGTLAAFTTGAAAVPPALLDRAARRGIISWRTYGMTEHPVISGGSPEHTEAQRHHTDGAVSPGVEVRILDDDGNDLPVGETGEIVTRGPKQFLGYGDEASTAEAFLPGFWFRTGDIGRLDGDGHLTISDRKKDLIIRGGENVSSKEVENHLMQLDAVSEAAVCAAPDELFGEAVCAFVILRPDATLTLDEVRDHFASLGVAKQKAPSRLEVVESLPRTPSGKVRKVDLRRRLALGPAN